MKKTEKEVVPKNDWFCETCNSKIMSHAEMMEHITTAHGLNPKNLKCSKKMLMHVDGADWYSYQWEITPVGTELKLINNTVSKRSPEDAAYWH